MARLGNRRRGLPVTAEINVASLVDVAFVLLVIFIITAPIMQGGVEVQLPQAASAPITTSQEAAIVTVTREGAIYIGEVKAETVEDFTTIFPQYMKQKGAQQAFLKGDRDVPYGKVLAVLGLMKKLDVAEVGLVADPELEK
jgi:biopolymer transport protein ExbD